MCFSSLRRPGCRTAIGAAAMQRLVSPPPQALTIALERRYVHGGTKVRDFEPQLQIRRL
jgi:hypothetical protein